MQVRVVVSSFAAVVVSVVVNPLSPWFLRISAEVKAVVVVLLWLVSDASYSLYK